MARALRLAALLALVAGLLLVGRHLDQRGLLSVEALRGAMAAQGRLGVVLFLGAFAAGGLLHLPGMLFVLTAILCYGKLAGTALAWSGALASISLPFLLTRALVRGSVGRKADGLPALLTQAGSVRQGRGRELMRRMLRPLVAHPVRTVALLRVVFILSPPLNFGLALSPIRYRDYLIGSALGLLPPLSLSAVFFDWLFARL